MDFTGKRVLVTGSTRGIGRAAAEMFLAAGARVAINGRTAGSVATAAREIGNERAVIALARRAPRIIRVRPRRRLVVRAGHADDGLRLEVVEREVHRGAAVVLRSRRRVRRWNSRAPMRDWRHGGRAEN